MNFDAKPHRAKNLINDEESMVCACDAGMCFASCSDGDGDDLEPTPKPEVVTPTITIDAGILTNGLSFGVDASENTVSFSTNVDWTLSVASTTGGSTWCTASVTSGSKGTVSVKFTVTENTGYDDRSVSATIKAGTASKTFTITQKGVEALLVTTDKYELEQEGGQIEIEVKANIEYQMEISETAKSWITESSGRALTTHKHTLTIAANEEVEKREGEIYFKSGDKVETVKVYQSGGTILMLTQDEYTVSDAGETITVDIKSNFEYGVQMPDVDWITDEASSRGMSSHTLKYVIAPNETYDSRSAEIIFYDKNSDLKDTLKVIQVQKDAIVISEKWIRIDAESDTIEVKLSTNVDFEIEILEADWIKQINSSRSLAEHMIKFSVSANEGEKNRKGNIVFRNTKNTLSDTLIVVQRSDYGYFEFRDYYNRVAYVKLYKAGTLWKTLNLHGCELESLLELEVAGPINGDDIGILHYQNLSLDLSEATIEKGRYDYHYYNDMNSTWHSKDAYNEENRIASNMFAGSHFTGITLPKSVISIGKDAFYRCPYLTFVNTPTGLNSIGSYAFHILYLEASNNQE